MSQWIAMGIGALAGLAWLSAAVHALLLLGHRADHVSLLSLLFNGWRFYQQDTWKPSGWPVYRRFLGSALTFFLLCLAAIVVAVATSS